jgi:hypothetical protein
MKSSVLLVKGGATAMISGIAYLLGGMDNGIEALCIMAATD